MSSMKCNLYRFTILLVGKWFPIYSFNLTTNKF